MDENTYWAVIWSLVAGVLLVTIVTTAIYWIHRNETIENMVNAGADPVSVYCAIENDYGNQGICYVHEFERRKGE